MDSMGSPKRDNGSRLALAAIVAAIAAAAFAFVWIVARDRGTLVEARRGPGPGMTAGTAAPDVPAYAGPEPSPAPPFPAGAPAEAVAPPETAGTSEEVFRIASPSVVTVKVFGGEDRRLTTFGSGVVVGPGTVATNRHVVESGGELRVSHQGRDYAATVLHADREYDLCSLSAPGLPAPPADTASVGTVRAGQRVYAIGAPRGLELSISDGLVSAVRPYGEFPLIQTNAAISKGSSGGGLFDTGGRLVGITTASAIDGQNINFALPADLVRRLPERSADIRTLDPIVPVRRAEEVNDKALIDELHESRRAIAESESELKAMVEELNRQTSAMNELRRAMNGFAAASDAKSYNELVPRYNEMNGTRNELVNRLEEKQRAHLALVERYNRAAERRSDRGRMRP